MKSLQGKEEKTVHLNSRFQNLLEKAREHPLWRLESALVAGAIVCGLFSGLISHLNASEAQRKLASIFATRNVLVASRDLAAGDTIDKGCIRIAEMLEKNISANVVTPKTSGFILGRKVIVELKEGDPLMLSAIQGASEATSMAEKIPAGQRLFMLRINDKAVGHGFVKPNDHVDVLAHIDLAGRGFTTFTVLQNVTLVSVGASSVLNESGSASGTDVSFFVDPKKAEVLAFAEKHGEFSLSLRNPQDNSQQEGGKGVDLNEFLDADGINKASGGGELKVTEKGHDIVGKK